MVDFCYFAANKDRVSRIRAAIKVVYGRFAVEGKSIFVVNGVEKKVIAIATNAIDKCVV